MTDETNKENAAPANPFEMNGVAIKKSVDDFIKDMRANPATSRTGMKVISSHLDPLDGTLYVDVEFTPVQPLTTMTIPNSLRQQVSDASFLGYFEDSIEYPRNVASNPIPMNTLWTYISSTFLNGFINYVEVVDAQLLNRYHQMDEYFNSAEDGPFAQYHDGNGWVTPPDNLSKRALFDLYTQSKNSFHPKLNCFGDDVLILGRCKNDGNEEIKGMYMFFWFDQDVSDCCIGRFQTDDEESAVIEKFHTYANKYLKYDAPSPIPISFFKGWLSF